MRCAHCLSVQKCRVGLGKCAHCLSVQCSLGKCGYWDHLGAHLHPPAQSQKKNLKKNHKKNLKKKSKKKILRPPWSSFTFTSTCSSFLHCSSCKDSSPDYFGIKIFTIVQLTINHHEQLLSQWWPWLLWWAGVGVPCKIFVTFYPLPPIIVIICHLWLTPPPVIVIY